MKGWSPGYTELLVELSLREYPVGFQASDYKDGMDVVFQTFFRAIFVPP